MYVRKSDDVEEILESLKNSIVYIASKLSALPEAKSRRQYVYLEAWALDALETYIEQTSKNLRLQELSSSDEKRTLGLPNSNVVLKEWNPEDD